MEQSAKIWQKLWNEQAKSENMFVQAGRSSYTPLEFFIMIKDICDSLDFEKNDIVLDVGGGAGWVSVVISPFVEKIVLFDFAQEMVNKAKEITKCFKNIEVYNDDILFMKNIEKNKYSKVVVSSVLQYLANDEQVENAIYNTYNVTKKGGKIIFTHNPDIRKKQSHIQSYSRLDWEEEKLQRALEMEEKRLWLDVHKIGKICNKIGFSEFYETPINTKLWQSTHMFDFVIVR